MRPAIQEALGAFKDHLVMLYGKRLEALIVVGLTTPTHAKSSSVTVVLSWEVVSLERSLPFARSTKRLARTPDQPDRSFQRVS